MFDTWIVTDENHARHSFLENAWEGREFLRAVEGSFAMKRHADKEHRFAVAQIPFGGIDEWVYQGLRGCSDVDCGEGSESGLQRTQLKERSSHWSMESDLAKENSRLLAPEHSYRHRPRVSLTWALP